MPDNTHDHDQDQHFDAAARVRGRRNRFYRRKVMTASAYQTEQEYFIQRRRLLTRSVMGWGIAFGFALKTEQDGASPARWSVGRGLALDKKGREIEIEVDEKGVTLDRCNVFLAVKTDKGFRAVELDDQQMAAEKSDYLLSIHYAERHAVDVRVDDGCGCHRHEHQFIDETVVFSLSPVSSDTRCGVDPCPNEGQYERDAWECPDRGPHRQLEEWSRHTSVADETKLGCEWGRYFVDLDAGVPLGIVSAKRHDDRCQALTLTPPKDPHSPRRVLKRNDMLYDLIRGCDLTRIKKISWHAFHRSSDQPIPFNTFKDEILKLQTEEKPSPTGSKMHGTALTIEFSGPVRTETLRPDCFSLNFMVFDADTGWRDTRFVPISALKYGDRYDPKPPALAEKVTLMVDSDWAEEVLNSANVLQLAKFRMEILIHGDYILDTRGQAIDANALGLAAPDGTEKSFSGNGAPGGTFRSLLWIDKADASRGGGN